MEANSSEDTLRLLRDKGVRFGTAIDIGSADGTYFLHMHRLGLLPDAVIFNVDPNPLYEPSLERIREVLGGGYSICALSDRIGTTELTLAAHPYWSSLRSAEDAYWRRVNHAG